MSGKTTQFANELLQLLFHNTVPSGGMLAALNITAGSATSLYISLHEGDPTDSAPSGQQSSETTYTGYLRVALNRANTDWTITSNVVKPYAPIEFAICGAMSGSKTITHVGIGTAPTGAGKLLHSGPLPAPIVVATGVTPRLTTASTLTED